MTSTTGVKNDSNEEIIPPTDQRFHELVVNVRKEKCEVYVGRGSKWGNKFVIGKDGNREEVIKKYRKWLWNRKDLLDCLGELKGKKLGCWCAPEACHAEVLIRAINWKVR